jgi:hypothetical protein
VLSVSGERLENETDGIIGLIARECATREFEDGA